MNLSNATSTKRKWLVLLGIAPLMLIGCSASDQSNKSYSLPLAGYGVCTEPTQTNASLTDAFEQIENADGIQFYRNGYYWQFVRNDEGSALIQIQKRDGMESRTINVRKQGMNAAFVLVSENGSDWTLQQELPVDEQEDVFTKDWSALILGRLFPNEGTDIQLDDFEQSDSFENAWLAHAKGINQQDLIYQAVVSRCGMIESVQLQAGDVIGWTSPVWKIENGSQIMDQVISIADSISKDKSE